MIKRFLYDLPDWFSGSFMLKTDGYQATISVSNTRSFSYTKTKRSHKYVSIFDRLLSQNKTKQKTNKQTNKQKTDVYRITHALANSNLLWFASLNNKAFCNLLCNPQKICHTSPTQKIEAVIHSSNSSIAFTKNKQTIKQTNKQTNKTKQKQNKQKQNKKQTNKPLRLVVDFFVNAVVEFEEWLTSSIIWVKTLLWITK